MVDRPTSVRLMFDEAVAPAYLVPLLTELLGRLTVRPDNWRLGELLGQAGYTRLYVTTVDVDASAVALVDRRGALALDYATGCCQRRRMAAR